MKIEVAKHERMAERGSSLLKLLQNNDTPLLDLLIRESVQNSLDAAQRDFNFVNVDLGVKDFFSGSLVNQLEGIQEGLKSRFGDTKAKALYITDTNTVGLTGPFHAEEVENNDYGNLQKLVYEISIPQQKEGAGGSWGLGKTVYFRFGIGLVIYYSRIKKEDGEFEERLAATMVENEKSEDSILPPIGNKPKRGIAWWGQASVDNSTVPITDSNEIKEILDIFSISQFKDQETGTTIIIPYIDEEKILPKENVWWNSSIEEYLNVSFQRWYGTRIDNPTYPYGSWLNAFVGGKRINFEDMEPIFQIFQSMYNGALSEKPDKIQKLSRRVIDFNVNDVNLRNDFEQSSNGNAGKVAFAKVSQESLKMLPPENRYDPYKFLNLTNNLQEGNPPIIVYLRRPGMVVNYEIDGAWCKDIPVAKDNEFIIGLFVPNSNSRFKNHYMEDYGILEQYLRRSEKADHTSWKDLMNEEKKITVITRIQNNVSKIIREKYIIEKDLLEKGKKSGLSRTLASKFLPPQNFGRKPTVSPQKEPGQSKFKKLSGPQFEIKNQKVDDNGILHLDFEIKSPKLHKFTIEVVVLSESGLIKGDVWESEKGVGTIFPLEITEVKVNDFGPIGVNKALENIDPEEASTLPLTIIKTDKFGIACGLEYTARNFNSILNGVLKIVRKDPFVQPSVSLSSVGVISKDDK